MPIYEYHCKGCGHDFEYLVLGGSEPGPATLMNFYALHTAILPALLLFGRSKEQPEIAQDAALLPSEA